MRAAAVGVAFVWMVAVAAAQHETHPPVGPALVPSSLVGSVSFDLYCASCHGRDGGGDGPVAAALRRRPADLREVATRHGGVFPREAVAAYIDGTARSPAAHGSSDMPVWGPTLRALETSDARARVRLDNLVDFVESLQRPVPAAAASAPARVDGAALFQTYCASCHGRDARGDGPMTAQLRRLPADLTKYATRNGGVFPEAHVARIIDGRGVPAHGSTEMPVWGRVFTRTGSGIDEAATRARIAALVQFLAAIQERPAE